MNKLFLLLSVFSLIASLLQPLFAGKNNADTPIDSTLVLTEEQQKMIAFFEDKLGTILRWSTGVGDLGLTRYAVEKGADVDSMDNRDLRKWTPLFHAAQHGYIDIMQYLIGQGAMIWSPHSESTVLDAAVAGGHLDAIEWIVSQNLIDMHPQGKRARRDIAHLLVIAASWNHPAVIEWLVEEQKINVNTHSRSRKASNKGRRYYTYGEQAFLLAARNGSLPIIQFLDNHKVNIHVKDEYGENAIFKAIFSGSLETIEWLAQQGVELQLSNNCQKTLLHEAARWYKVEIMRWLLDQGVDDVHARDCTGRTAKDLIKDKLPSLKYKSKIDKAKEIIRMLELAEQQHKPVQANQYTPTPTPQPSRTVEVNPLAIDSDCLLPEVAVTEQEPWYGDLASGWRSPEALALLALQFARRNRMHSQ